jgi:hypothetical protein
LGTLGFGIGEVLVGGGALLVQPDLFASYFGWSSEQARRGSALLLGAFVGTLVLRRRRAGTLR